MSTMCSVKKITMVPHLKGFSFSIYGDCCQIQLFNILPVKSMDICGQLCQKITVLYEKSINKKNKQQRSHLLHSKHSIIQIKRPVNSSAAPCSKCFVISVQILTLKYSCPFKNIVFIHSFSLFCYFVCLSPVNMSGIKCHMAFRIRYDAMEFPVFGQSLR